MEGSTASSGPADASALVEAYERLRKLQAITEAALSHLGLDDLLEELLNRMLEVFAVDTCAVLLIDGEELAARAAKGLEEEVERGVRIPLGRGFAGRIAAERRPVVIDDVDHADILNPLLREKGVKSLLGVPLIVHGNVLGVIHIGSLKPRRFTEDEVELLQLAADRAALGLEKGIVHDELVRVDRLKRTFVALASHELRTPATSVHGLAATLYLRRGDLKAEQTDQLVQVLYEESDRLARLTEQLLDLSRLDALEFDLNPELIRIRAEVERLAARFANELEVELKIASDLEAIVDLNAFEHILSNLILNAVRYGAPPLTVSAEQRDRHFRVAVEDRGQGVPTALVPHLFEWFQRGRDAREKGGSGLGLAIAKSYAQASGGDLLYTPVQPHGARFELVLPRL